MLMPAMLLTLLRSSSACDVDAGVGCERALLRGCSDHGAWGRSRRCRDLRLRQERCDANPSDNSC